MRATRKGGPNVCSWATKNYRAKIQETKETLLWGPHFPWGYLPHPEKATKNWTEHLRHPGLRGQKLDFKDLQKGKAWWIPHAVGWASAMPHARSKWSRNSLDLTRTEAHLQITLIPDCINMIQIDNSTSHLPETNINPPWSTISLL